MKYLFIAYFKDGNMIFQPEDDKSAFFEGKSAFTDVLEKEKDSELHIFALTDGTNTVLCDLNDGAFEVNGLRFYLHNTDHPIFNRRLIYFRRMFAPRGENELQTLGFFVGWQGNDHNNHNIKHTIQLP